MWLAAEHFRNNGDRQLILESLASRLAPKDIPDAIEQAKEIGGELCHARVLASVAQHLSPEQLSEGVVAADELKEDLHALHIQVQRLSTEQQTLFVKSLAKLAAELPRDQALKAIASSRHIFVAVGGSKLKEDLCRAIIDTGRWYP